MGVFWGLLLGPRGAWVICSGTCFGILSASEVIPVQRISQSHLPRRTSENIERGLESDLPRASYLHDIFPRFDLPWETYLRDMYTSGDTLGRVVRSDRVCHAAAAHARLNPSK